jgi:hypothetical protein
MPAIDRVMRAYTSKHELNAEQATLVRLELSNFIGELMSRVPREPTMLPEKRPQSRPVLSAAPSS